MSINVIHSARALDSSGWGEDAWVAFDDSRITATGTGTSWQSVNAEKVIDAAGKTLTPAFVDIHGHGGGGKAFDGGSEDSKFVREIHRQHGTGFVVGSLVSLPWDETVAAFTWARELMQEFPAFLGLHLEGPFLSLAKKGAHEPKNLIAPADQLVDDLVANADVIRQITMAPELEHSADAIPRLRAAGITVALGHTDCDYDTAKKTFASGVNLVTHLFNAMNSIHHRQPGPVVAAIENPHVNLEIVADGIHVDPALVAQVFAWAPGRVVLITDSMAAAGLGDGEYLLGALEAEVKDGKAVIAGTDTIAGSTLTLEVAFKNVINWGIDPVAAVTALTTHAMASIAWDEDIALQTGSPAQFNLFDSDWNLVEVITASAWL